MIHEEGHLLRKRGRLPGTSRYQLVGPIELGTQLLALDVDVRQRSLSSQRGMHQADRPSSAITAGTSVIRTTNASTSDADRQREADRAMIVSGARMNPANTLS